MKCIDENKIKCEFNDGGFCKKYNRWTRNAYLDCELNDNAIGTADKLKTEAKVKGIKLNQPQKHTQVIKYDGHIFYSVMSFARHIAGLEGNTASVAMMRRQFYIWKENNSANSQSTEWINFVDEDKLEIIN